MYAEEKHYEIPSAGLHNSVLADIIDLGVKKYRNYEPKHMLTLVFLVDQVGENRQPLQVHVLCAKSLGTSGKPSKLRKIGSALLSPVPLPRRLELDPLIGKGCILNIVHVTKDGTTHANFDGAFAADRGAPLLSIAGYKRVPTEQSFSGNPEIDAKVQRSIRAGADGTAFPEDDDNED